MKNINKEKQEQIKEKLEPLVASLLPDSDKKMGAIASVSLVVALALCFWASTFEVLYDDSIFEKTEGPALKTTMNIIEKKEEKTPPKEEKKKKEEITRKRNGGGGKRVGQGNPRAPENRGVLRVLASQTKNASASVYDLMKNQKFAHDIDKVIKNAYGLQMTGKTNIGAPRRGKIDGEFNEGIASGGSGGIENSMMSLFGASSGRISTNTKGKFTLPSPKDIDMGAGTSSRSASDIMKVVRNRTPGLRYIYNKFLKKKPGFQGKVTLRFAIAPGGEVIQISIVTSTTGYDDFDYEIKEAVRRWTFNKVKSGNTTVTIPFTFTE